MIEIEVHHAVIELHDGTRIATDVDVDEATGIVRSAQNAAREHGISLEVACVSFPFHGQWTPVTISSIKAIYCAGT